MGEEKATNKSTEVVKKKNSQKLWQTMFSFDRDELKNTVVNRIVIPGINNLISTTLKSIIDGIFKTNGGYSNNSTPTASYQSYWSSGTVPKSPANRIANPLNEDIWVKEEARAREIVTDIKMDIVNNGFATVGRLFARADQQVPYTAENWVWYTFNPSIVPGKNGKGEDGWVIITPPAVERK